MATANTISSLSFVYNDTIREMNLINNPKYQNLDSKNTGNLKFLKNIIDTIGTLPTEFFIQLQLFIVLILSFSWISEFLI